MRKAKKSPKFQYGIEITKPFSKEMYNHNDMVAEEMKANLLHHWNQIIKRMEDDDKWTLDREWDEDEIKAPKSKGGYGFPELVKLQRGICYSGYGGGYTIQDVCDEFKNELDTMQNWQLHENYSYLSFEGIVRRTKHMMIGFDWCKHDYGRELIVDPQLEIKK